MKKKKKKFLITFYTQLDNGYIDERQMIVKNKYNAKNIYNDLASQNSTVSIELEQLKWKTTLTNNSNYYIINT